MRLGLLACNFSKTMGGLRQPGVRHAAADFSSHALPEEEPRGGQPVRTWTQRASSTYMHALLASCSQSRSCRMAPAPLHAKRPANLMSSVGGSLGQESGHRLDTGTRKQTLHSSLQAHPRNEME